MHAQLEFKLPNETETRRAVLHPYSIKDASPYLDENKGAAYFVPHGYQPILVPQNDEDATIQALLDLAVPTVQAVKVQIPLRQTLLPHYIIKPCKKSKTVKPIRPPRPPNAFILYRQNQQAHILRQNANLCNNDVSRIIGNMWNGESPLIKQRFHLLAQKMKEQHRAMYPMYRYCPRKASERKKKVKTKVPQEQTAFKTMQPEQQLTTPTIIQPPQWDHNIETEETLLNTQNLALGTTALDINEFTTAPLWV
ncbi:uncharacterized protein T551_02162 [Pneumocystis jirovecii RU7]|uniref:HMG box domain-containing protein n=1 Tax=Pneumocystis jirovecii (strain RU7) TaxID=1408657 RepID=A0A0W4ZME2_PNEJ7|nr:uncharacterized protein T551_02162 [Pneumocystis jirovecii RU7]KTW29546.1 hypothetical protein T551_02162 [Pneumocystis jirovecii RU7]